MFVHQNKKVGASKVKMVAGKKRKLGRENALCSGMRTTSLSFVNGEAGGYETGDGK